MYIKEDDITDIDRIDDYNNEYLSVYPDFVPFVTRENFSKFLKDVEDKKNGINNDGIKELFFFAIEDDKIIGHGSIRLNPEVNPYIDKICGHIMYGVVPSQRGKGYGKRICNMLLDKMDELGYSEAVITCNVNNIASRKVIDSNYILKSEIVTDELDNNEYYRCVLDVKKSLEKNHNLNKNTKQF